MAPKEISGRRSQAGWKRQAGQYAVASPPSKAEFLNLKFASRYPSLQEKERWRRPKNIQASEVAEKLDAVVQKLLRKVAVAILSQSLHENVG